MKVPEGNPHTTDIAPNIAMYQRSKYPLFKCTQNTYFLQTIFYNMALRKGLEMGENDTLNIAAVQPCFNRIGIMRVGSRYDTMLCFIEDIDIVNS